MINRKIFCKSSPWLLQSYQLSKQSVFLARPVVAIGRLVSGCHFKRTVLTGFCFHNILNTYWTSLQWFRLKTDCGNQLEMGMELIIKCLDFVLFGSASHTAGFVLRRPTVRLVIAGNSCGFYLIPIFRLQMNAPTSAVWMPSRVLACLCSERSSTVYKRRTSTYPPSAHSASCDRCAQSTGYRVRNCHFPVARCRLH